MYTPYFKAFGEGLEIKYHILNNSLSHNVSNLNIISSSLIGWRES